MKNGIIRDVIARIHGPHAPVPVKLIASELLSLIYYWEWHSDKNRQLVNQLPVFEREQNNVHVVCDDGSKVKIELRDPYFGDKFSTSGRSLLHVGFEFKYPFPEKTRYARFHLSFGERGFTDVIGRVVGVGKNIGGKHTWARHWFVGRGALDQLHLGVEDVIAHGMERRGLDSGSFKVIGRLFRERVALEWKPSGKKWVEYFRKSEGAEREIAFAAESNLLRMVTRLSEEIQSEDSQDASEQVQLDDLMSLSDFAILTLKSAKTIRNKKILGEPARKGGGRGLVADWHYLEKAPLLETWIGERLPSLAEARKMLVDCKTVSSGKTI